MCVDLGNRDAKCGTKLHRAESSVYRSAILDVPHPTSQHGHHADGPSSDLPAPPRQLVSHHTKPIDFGSNGVCASLALNGLFLGIFSPHPVHGQIVVNPWAQFPADQYRNQAFVRAYRARPMEAHARDGAGFGLSVAVQGEARCEDGVCGLPG